MTRFLEKRIQNILGDSALDDQVSKALIREIETQVEALLSEIDPRSIAYRQGYIAALRSAIEKVRLNNKQQYNKENDD